MADDVFTDVCRWCQAVQPVEEFYTGNMMLPCLFVQLIPEHTGHSLENNNNNLLLLLLCAIASLTCINALYYQNGFPNHLSLAKSKNLGHRPKEMQLSYPTRTGNKNVRA